VLDFGKPVQLEAYLEKLTICCLIQVGIIKDQERTVSSQFEGDLLQAI
jgi:hypothetical protein